MRRSTNLLRMVSNPPRRRPNREGTPPRLNAQWDCDERPDEDIEKDDRRPLEGVMGAPVEE